MNPVSKKLSSEEIFKMIDTNQNGKIDDGDDLASAAVFGLKLNDKKINEKKIKDFEKKAGIFASVKITNNSLTVEGDKNNVIIQNGNNNSAKISTTENKNNISFNSENGMYSDEAQLAIYEKGLEPQMLLDAGFDKITRKTAQDGTVKLILESSKDGYSITISDFNEEASIKRDDFGNLVLDNVAGEVKINPSNSKAHEIVLSNAKNLVVKNNSGVPLTKTYLADDKGKLSEDAVNMLNQVGFDAKQVQNAHFNKVQLTENPSGQNNIHFESSEHGFVMDVAQGHQADEMKMEYNKLENKLTVEKLSNADISINNDGSDEHKFQFSNCSQVTLENKSQKPVHITRDTMVNENGKSENDISSFEYKTDSNFDTYTANYVKHYQTKTTTINVPHLKLYRTQKTIRRKNSCNCNNSNALTKSRLVLVNNPKTYTIPPVKINIPQKGDTIKIAPGSYTIQPTKQDYNETDRQFPRTDNYITINDYVNEKEDIEHDQCSDKSKIALSERSFYGLDITYEDNSTLVRGNSNNVIIQNGENNTAEIHNGNDKGFTEDAKNILSEQFNFNIKMFEKAGFNNLTTQTDESGRIVLLELSDNEGTKLTIPADEAYIFSDQMTFEKVKGGYRISNFVGQIDTCGKDIFCQNVSLVVNDTGEPAGSLTYTTAKTGNTPSAIDIEYNVADDQKAVVYQLTDGKVKQKTTKSNSFETTRYFDTKNRKIVKS